MARVAVAKRARVAQDTELEPPAKRTRRQTRSFQDGNDENADPAAVGSDDNTNSLRGDDATAEITEESLPKAPAAAAAAAGAGTTSRKPAPTPTPAKQPLTPSTPRFRDALARAPVTPRHRVMGAGKIFKRTTPQTPLTPNTVQTIYHHARQLFSRSADPGQLIGRDDERKQLRTFLQRCATSTPSGCIYVSGPPGTGKSAMVHEMTREAAEASAVKKAYVNCMSIKSAKDLYATLLGLLCDEADVPGVDDAAAVIQKLFMPRKKSSDVYLVVLDEIDHLLTIDLENLYRVFEWSMHKTSRLVLVGIANALDLTDRFLPRLKSRNLKPELLPFLPYSAAQIKNIITSRLQSVAPKAASLPFFHPAAIELCSRKVSSQTGDLRKAFEICRRAIDLVEMETKQKHEADIREKMLLASPSRKVLGETVNQASPPRGTPGKTVSESLISSLKGLTMESAPRVTIAHLNKITAAAFSNGTSQRLRTLNLQQKAALCSLVALEKRNRASKSSVTSTPSKSHSSAPSIKALYDTYCLLCKQDSVLHPLSSSEFREVMGSLETLSLIGAVDGKTGSFVAQTPSKRTKKSAFGSQAGLADEKKVASNVGEKDMEQAIEGIGAGILQSILSGEALA